MTVKTSFSSMEQMRSDHVKKEDRLASSSSRRGVGGRADVPAEESPAGTPVRHWRLCSRSRSRSRQRSKKSRDDAASVSDVTTDRTPTPQPGGKGGGSNEKTPKKKRQSKLDEIVGQSKGQSFDDNTEHKVLVAQQTTLAQAAADLEVEGLVKYRSVTGEERQGQSLAATEGLPVV